MSAAVSNVIQLEQIKRCPMCGHEKPVSAYYPHREYGIQGYCKTCTRQYVHTRYRQKNPVVKMNIPDRATKMKRCSSCGETKSWSEYYWDKKRDLPEPKCRECVLRYRLNRRERNREALRLAEWHRSLRRRYGMTPLDYATRLAAQNGRCKLCGSTDAGRKFGFVVDHDHNTGHVRGLLCCKCNAGLGMFDDSVERMRGAILYLEKSE